MQKIFIILFLIICPTFLFGQKVIKVVSYETINGDLKNNLTHFKNPVFQQDNATMTCDSATFYNKRNYFEAYGNVHIHQEQTDIYSDNLDYDGNKKHAHLSNNVKMIDPTSVLTTNILDYDMVAQIGTYTTGGKIVNKDVTLTSKNGYYFKTSADAYFRYDVVVVTPQSTIKSDTLRYNMHSKWTYFYGPTNIKGKDDNLYTENGAYNTQTQNAYFGKKNLYTQESRSLKGDSLYYDGVAGVGKAVKNIVFSDSKDKTKLFGDLGYYYKADQRTLVTGRAYLGIGTADSITVNNKKIPDSLFLGADTLETKMVLQKDLTLIPKISIQADNQIGDDEEVNPANKEEKYKPAVENPNPIKTGEKGGNKRNSAPKKNSNKDKVAEVSKKITDQPKQNLDSIAKISLKKVQDSILKDSLVQKIDTKIATLPEKVLSKDSLKNPIKFNPADTIKARTIRAYRNVKIFKSNMQAKTDSLFYTSADSTLRCFVNPIIWSERSQQIGDTIYVQLKKNKLDNLQAFKNAFLVNTLEDSLRFNQIKGRVMTGFFNEGKIKSLYVDGNAESIYYTRDDSTKVYKEMNQTLSSRIKFVFNKNDIQDIVYIKNIEGALNPEVKVEKDHVLTGFSWKPNERPKSKKEVIGAPLKTTKAKAVTNKTTNNTSKGNNGVKKYTPIDKGKSLENPIIIQSDSIKNKGISPKKDALNKLIKK